MAIKPRYQVTQEKARVAQPPMLFLSPSHVSKANTATPGSNGRFSWFLRPFCSLCLPHDLIPEVLPNRSLNVFPIPSSPLLIICNVIMGILLELIPDSFKCSMRLSWWIRSWHLVIFWSFPGREHTRFTVFIGVLPSGITAKLNGNIIL